MNTENRSKANQNRNRLSKAQGLIQSGRSVGEAVRTVFPRLPKPASLALAAEMSRRVIQVQA